jgi:hypothetical protein
MFREHTDVVGDLVLPAQVTAVARGCISRTAAAPSKPPRWYRHLVELGAADFAIEAAGREPHTHRRAQAYATVSVAMSREGPCQRAAEIAALAAAEAGNVTDLWTRAECQASAADALVTAGGAALPQAIAVAQSISEGTARVRALCAIASVIARAGSPDAATSLVRLARAAADTAGFPGTRSEALACVVDGLVAAGLGDDGRAVAAEIGDHWARAEAFISVATGIPDPSALAQALSAARAVSNSNWRAEAQAAIAEAMCALGDPADALRIAEAIKDPVWHAESLLAVAAVSEQDTAISLAESAIRIGESVRYQWWQSERLAHVIAGLLARAPDDLRPLEWLRLPWVLISTLRAMPVACDLRPVLAAINPAQLTDWHACDLLAGCALACQESAAELRGLAM